MSADTSPAPDPAPPREVVLVTGISGSGKSVALHALEDAGYVCVDNLPPELLRDFVRLEHARDTHRVAVAADVRVARSLPALVQIRSLFLDASTDTLVRRFSETRRPHPLANAAAHDTQHALVEAIELERLMLGELREVSTVIDTSQLRPAQLRGWIRRLVDARSSALTLVFESFAFKYGVPLDADYVFDVRVLPNPYYIRELRALTGADAPVIEYLRAQPESEEMLSQIEAFLRHWLPLFQADQRSYLTVAIGCTGGQHRSVYMVEQLARRFQSAGTTLMRHRELDASD
jgi:UPF0042 nucleotide-binding protein